MAVLQYLFMRSYGYMLGRKFRALPAQACQDAIGPYMIAVGVPVNALILMVLAVIYPKLLATKDWIPWVVIPQAVVGYLMSRSFQRFADSPEVAAPFISPKSRRATMFGYLGILIGSILIAGGLGRLLMHR